MERKNLRKTTYVKIHFKVFQDFSKFALGVYGEQKITPNRNFSSTKIRFKVFHDFYTFALDVYGKRKIYAKQKFFLYQNSFQGILGFL